jgi:hypothetical protein
MFESAFWIRHGPSSVHLAVPRGSYHYIKLSIPGTPYRFNPKTFNEGLETHHT